MMAHSRGVILRNRGAGFHRYRDEIKSDGGKDKMHRQVRRTEKITVRKMWGHLIR